MALMMLLLLNTFMIGDPNFNRPSGTTLLELVVTLGIFVMLVGSLTSAFLLALANERRALATQQVLDNTRYTLELMARAIRQANPPSSISTTSCGASPCLKFTHPLMREVTYNFQTSAIIQTTKGCSDDATNWCTTPGECNPGGGGSKTCEVQAVILTAPNVDVRNLSFILTGDDSSDGQQPRVTIGMTIGANPNLYPSTDIQTTVAIRTPQE